MENPLKLKREFSLYVYTYHNDDLKYWNEQETRMKLL